jgi:hypothetical protein
MFVLGECVANGRTQSRHPYQRRRTQIRDYSQQDLRVGQVNALPAWGMSNRAHIICATRDKRIPIYRLQASKQRKGNPLDLLAWQRLFSSSRRVGYRAVRVLPVKQRALLAIYKSYNNGAYLVRHAPVTHCIFRYDPVNLVPSCFLCLCVRLVLPRRFRYCLTALADWLTC